MVTGQEEGKKFDESKVRMDLVPPSIVGAVATVLTFGASKYGDRNWECGIKYSRVYGAMLRHILAWWEREDNDPESGFHHLWHAACCLGFLIHYESYRNKYKAFDDRPNYKEDTVWEEWKEHPVFRERTKKFPPGGIITGPGVPGRCR